MIKLRFLFLFALALVTLLREGAQSPAQGQSLSITPALVDAKVRRGVTYTKPFTVSNGTAMRLRLRCSIADFWYGENNERIDGEAGTLPRSASSWVQFLPANPAIEPYSSVTVNAIITIPKHAAGGYYAVPIFETEPDDENPVSAKIEPATIASVVIRFRGLLLLTTEDAAEYNVEIMNGDVTPPSMSSELAVQLDVRNRSTAHVNVHGIFAILDAAGRLAGRGEIEQKRYLPGQRDRLKATWAGELGAGRYTVMVTLTYDRAGMDRATLVYELPLQVNR